MSNRLMDRVAEPGTLTFSLNNSESNSAHVLGYYSPGRVNSLPGWNTGLPVRVTFGYDSWSIIKWRGFINPDGIRIVPGIYDLRQVEVACTDWMRKAADHKMDLTQIESNKYLSGPLSWCLPTCRSSQPARNISTKQELITPCR